MNAIKDLKQFKQLKEVRETPQVGEMSQCREVFSVRKTPQVRITPRATEMPQDEGTHRQASKSLSEINQDIWSVPVSEREDSDSPLSLLASDPDDQEYEQKPILHRERLGIRRPKEEEPHESVEGFGKNATALPSHEDHLSDRSAYEPGDSEDLDNSSPSDADSDASLERIQSTCQAFALPYQKAKGVPSHKDDARLVKWREEGKCFGEIRQLFGRLNGEWVSPTTYSRRYNALKEREELAKGIKPPTTKSKLSMQPYGTADKDQSEHLSDSDGDADQKGSLSRPAKRRRDSSTKAVRSSDDAAPRITVVNDEPYQRCGWVQKRPPIPLPRSLAEASKLDRMLVRLKGKENRPFEEIHEKWKAMGGPPISVHTLGTRYRRLTALPLKPPVKSVKPKVSTEGIKKEETDIAPVPSGRTELTAKHQGTKRNPISIDLLDDTAAPKSASHCRAIITPSPTPATESKVAYLPDIAAEKLINTILRIPCAGSYSSLRLRLHKTFSELYEAVATICDLPNGRKGAATLKVTFPWMAEEDPNRTTLLKEHFEDSYELFLETIDEAPCWEVKGNKCMVFVEPVQ